MLITLNDIIKLMEKIAPPALAEDWDNVGLMLGRRDKEVRKILLALDMTKQSVDQAIAQKVDLIITHHPAVFKKLNSLTDAVWQQELLLSLAENSIAIYSAHTNFDIVNGGVNESLAKKLQLTNVSVLDDNSGLGRIGEIEEFNLDDFAAFVKQQLCAEYVVVCNAGRTVQKVAICGGAGADFIHQALAKGADTLVTGDVKYHSAQEAVFSGLNVIDAGHQSTELPAMQDLKDRLDVYCQKQNWEIEIFLAKEDMLLKAI